MLAIGAALTLAACSSTQPRANLPIGPQPPAPSIAAVAPPAPSGQARPFVAAIALSGGGARASAFGLGVLKELKATQFDWQGRTSSILDEVGLVSGVSGGSVLASYYVAFGAETFTRFGRDFLMADFPSMTSPLDYRSNILEKRLERLYRGTRFADLLARRSGPRLLVTATDLTTGTPFEFMPEQFALVCADLASVPLSVAVAASSAVPPLLMPVTLRNYAGSCGDSKQGSVAARGVHLVDGALVDTLGVRGLLAHLVAGSWPDLRTVPAGSVHKMVLISVSSERATATHIDSDDKVPTPLQVLDALGFGAGSPATQEAIAAMTASARRALSAARGTQGSPFAADAEIYVISVNLRDLNDEKTRNALLQVPTAFSILPTQVRQLEDAGRAVLRESPQFQQLGDALGAPRRDQVTGPNTSP